MLFPYNLPPWMVMKQSSMILSMIIPGKQMPGNDIDVYLQPLIKELKELWDDGVPTFDASTKEMFCMRAALMWTLSDFPGLGNLSGWNIHTGLACPSCNYDAAEFRLQHGKKNCFMGHRRFLPEDHIYRFDREHFDGKEEFRNPPVTPTGSVILQQQESVETTKTGPRTILMQEEIFRRWVYALKLWPDVNERYLPASFKLTVSEKDTFLSELKGARLPDGFSSNFSRCIDLRQRRIHGLKSHDCHVIAGSGLPLSYP
ncbi:unnamed protein product [Microthlaspi erraticum]|uniref:Uncharacterized protein n=1 Tax=Microthlaspi erraticum TaxID=1685480 RepID=A0A6D2HKK8_9BRAS|nr:unnamed protein product [Microthlaspi erraticum]